MILRGECPVDIRHLVYNSKYDIMKKIIYSLLIVSSFAFAQETKNIGDFNKVTSFDRIDVFLIPSDENKVQLDGKDKEEVELVNKNGELKIRMPLTKLLDGDNISVTVYYKNLTAVEANEGSRIACGDKISSCNRRSEHMGGAGLWVVHSDPDAVSLL